MRIGVFLPNWVGDACMATPALRALRAHFGSDAEMLAIGDQPHAKCCAASPGSMNS